MRKYIHVVQLQMNHKITQDYSYSLDVLGRVGSPKMNDVLPETNNLASEIMGLLFKRKVVSSNFHPLIFGGDVSCREGRIEALRKR